MQLETQAEKYTKAHFSALHWDKVERCVQTILCTNKESLKVDISLFRTVQSFQKLLHEST